MKVFMSQLLETLDALQAAEDMLTTVDKDKYVPGLLAARTKVSIARLMLAAQLGRDTVEVEHGA